MRILGRLRRGVGEGKMIKKRYIFIIFTSVLFWSTTIFIGVILGNYFYDLDPAHRISYFKNMNKFTFALDKSIDVDKVEVLWNKSSIYKNGVFNEKHISDQYYKYGPNFFTVKYDSIEIYELRQYKYNNWHFFDYNIIIGTKNDSVYSKIEVEEPKDL